MQFSYSTWLPLFPKKSSRRGTASFGRNGRFHGNHLENIYMPVKSALWLSIGEFEVYLPPLNQWWAFHWCYYCVARESGCLATDILNEISLETRANINQIHTIPISTPSKLTSKEKWWYILVAMVHGYLATSYIYLATNVNYQYSCENYILACHRTF